ncbi:molybdenum cofactor guanylyltransferase [Methanolobus sp. ZRKC3]|uniref:molybdenum cofactor guanylyltransferase n=1 Tax=Methanolobus sp. ZRKC3 TaxID=3125786 RepID=UPI003249A289
MKRSSLLLAGGLGTRLNGKEKALLPFKEGALIENTLRVLDEVSDEVVISLRDESQVQYFSSYLQGRKTVTDSIRNIGPLAGMLEGFRKAEGEYILVVACDMPFLDSDILNELFEMVQGHDAVVPVSPGGKKEPLHAVYRRDPMISLIDESIGEGDRFVLSPVLKLSDVIYMDKTELKEIGGQLRTFANINSPEDMEMLNDNEEL